MRFPLSKEPSYRFLVFPTDHWHIVWTEGAGVGVEDNTFG